MTNTTTGSYDQPVTIPAHLLQYIDQAAIRADGDEAAADAFNAALDAAFPVGPPGGCGGYIDLPKVEYQFDSCKEEHPGQTHDEWSASFDH